MRSAPPRRSPDALARAIPAAPVGGYQVNSMTNVIGRIACCPRTCIGIDACTCRGACICTKKAVRTCVGSCNCCCMTMAAITRSFPSGDTSSQQIIWAHCSATVLCELLASPVVPHRSAEPTASAWIPAPNEVSKGCLPVRHPREQEVEQN
jgi:hypothetical protein